MLGQRILSASRLARHNHSRTLFTSNARASLFRAPSTQRALFCATTLIGTFGVASWYSEFDFPQLLALPTTLCEVINSGALVKEPKTGILFPQLCNGMYLVGCGVRVKYVFVKVYAVGTYVDPVALSAVKSSSSKDAIAKALLDPTYPRTIKIVMNRGLSAEKFLAAIVEALEPRMMGQDLEKLDEFKRLMPPVALVKGAEIEMTIRGDVLLFKNAMGGVGTIRSHVFTSALCDVYYGNDAVSLDHKEQVVEGIAKL